MTTVESRQIPPMRVHVPEEDVATITEQVAVALRTGQLSGGAHAAAFEQEFARFVGMPHAVAVSTGTAALEAIFRGLQLDDVHVLVPANTFIATAAAAIHAGNHGRVVDVDPLTGSPSLELLRKARTPETKAVVIVHIGGLMSPELPAIRDWCEAEGLVLVEDAAHAHGSSVAGRPAGTFGQAGAFSMFATKVMTSAEGGMVTTADEELARRVRVLRDHGKTDTAHNLHETLGHNWHLSELHAILGRSQLARLPDFLRAREAIAACYDEALGSVPDLTVLRPAGASSWYKYLALLPPGVDKAAVRQHMRERGVRLSGDVYDVPLPRQPVFAFLKMNRTFPGAEEFAARHICLPIYVQMTPAEVDQVVEALRDALEAVR